MLVPWVQIRILSETESGENKIKVMGVIVSDVDNRGLTNEGALRSVFGAKDTLAEAIEFSA